MERQSQNLPNLPPNVFIQYTNTGAPTNGDKNYYKIENLGTFQPSTVNTINLNQPISLINPQCIVDNNGFQTGVINNQCPTGNYVSLSTSNWNHSLQQVKNDEQMIYQIMYPIIENSGTTLDSQQLNKQTTVDGNLLAPSGGNTVVLTPAKNISLPKKQIINSYTIIDKQNQYTSTDVIPVAIVTKAEYLAQNQDAEEQMEENNENQVMDGESQPKGKKNKKKNDCTKASESFSCEICHEMFKSKASLRFHTMHHNPMAKNRFHCIGCMRGFEKDKLKQEHELTCEDNYKFQEFECCFCDMPFRTPKDLRSHENKHRPIRKTKRYRNTCVCIECHKAFDAIYSLKIHIQKHHKKLHVKLLDDKPYTCSQCGLGFKYERSKVKHEYKVHMKEDSAVLLTMDRYIVHNTNGPDSSDNTQQHQPQQHISVKNVTTSSGPETYIIEGDQNKQLLRCDQNEYKIINVDNGDKVDNAMCVQLDGGSQFNEGVGNTTYIIDNNSNNSIDSVRIGNHNYVPVIDSSHLYNISVAGSTGQYTIEGVVNPGLGNYIIETPTYIVEKQPQTMYIDEPMPQQPQQAQQPPPPPPTQQQQQQQHPPPQEQQQSHQEKTKDKKEGKKKVKEAEVGPFFCSVCRAEFNSSASLRFHSYHHIPKSKRFSCIGCEKAFEKDKEKEEHELSCEINYTSTKFSCIFCDIKFSTPKNLRNHENKHRPIKKSKKFRHMCVCIKCNTAFDAIYTLKMHIQKSHFGNAKLEKKKKKKEAKEDNSFKNDFSGLV